MKLIATIVLLAGFAVAGHAETLSGLCMGLGFEY